jgi:hypothetical protein
MGGTLSARLRPDFGSFKPDALNSRPLQSREGNCHQAFDGGCGWQTSSRAKGVQAVARKLVGRNIGSHLAHPSRLAQQLAHKSVQLPLCSLHVLAAMQELYEFPSMMASFVRNQGVRVEHRLYPLVRVRSVSDLSQMLQMMPDVIVMPRLEDRLDV